MAKRKRELRGGGKEECSTVSATDDAKGGTPQTAPLEGQSYRDRF